LKSIGRHFLLELKDCNSKLLDNKEKIEEILVMAAEKSRATVLNTYSHQFTPSGVTTVIALKESHISLHSWPEDNYCAVDIYTCGKLMKPEIAVNFIIKKLKCKNPMVSEVKRGFFKTKRKKKI
jgi:S-adenosylmethionine decarboxylase